MQWPRPIVIVISHPNQAVRPNGPRLKQAKRENKHGGDHSAHGARQLGAEEGPPRLTQPHLGQEQQGVAALRRALRPRPPQHLSQAGADGSAWNMVRK